MKMLKKILPPILSVNASNLSSSACLFLIVIPGLFTGCASVNEGPPIRTVEQVRAETVQPDSTPADSFPRESPPASIIEIIEESENAYNEAMVKYELGDLDASRELHEKAFRLLMEAKWRSIKDPAAHQILKEAFDDLYARLTTRFQDLTMPMEFELWASTEELSAVRDSVTPANGKSTFELPVDGEKELVKKYLNLFSQDKARRTFLEQSLKRSGRYRDMIISELKKMGMPRELWLVPVVESGYKITAYSNKRAAGLWQFIPSTARHYGLCINEWIDERRDPEKSTKAALTFLKELYEWFNSWELALAAYNRGLNNISSDIRNSRMVDFFEIADHNMTHSQTKNFVPQIHAAILIADNPEKYGFEIDYDEPLNPDKVTIDYVVDLGVVAKCVGKTEEDIKNLNPELRTWVTPVLSKDYPVYNLKLPSGTKERYLREITKVTDLTPDRRVRYIVKRGDTLGGIADKFRVSWKQIKRWNNIRGTTIYPGQSLYLRPGKGWGKSSKPTSVTVDKSGKAKRDYIVYKIQKGDTLSKIAENYNVRVVDIKNWNGIKNSRKIRPGQKLRIYLPS